MTVRPDPAAFDLKSLKDSSAVALITAPEAFTPRASIQRAPHGSRVVDLVKLACNEGGLQVADLPNVRLEIDGVELPLRENLELVPRAGQIVNLSASVHGSNSTARTFVQLFFQIGAAVVGWFYGPIAAAAVAIVGQAVDYLFFRPDAPDQLADANNRSALQDQSNQYRRRSSMPIVAGKQRVGFDVAALPYTQLVGNDVWLNVIFGLHYGPCTLADVRVGETALDVMIAAGDAKIEQWLTPGPRTIRLYPQRAPQQNLNDKLDLTGTGVWEIHTTEANTERAEVDIAWPSGLRFNKDNGSILNQEVRGRIEYALDGTEAWQPAPIGAFRNRQGQLLPVGDWYVQARTNDAVRRTFGFELPAKGKYKIRVRAYDPDNDDPDKSINDTYWTGLRSIEHVPPINDETLSLLVLSIKSSDDLNGALPVVSGVVEPIIPVWSEGAGWSGPPAASSNAAALVRWLCTGPAASSPMLAEEIDASCAEAFALIEANGWKGGIDFREEVTLQDAIVALGRMGRFSCYWNGSALCFVSDWAKPVPRQLFTGRNADGYGYKRTIHKPVHAVFVEFKNVDKDSAADELIVYADGYSEAGEVPGTVAAEIFTSLRLDFACSAERAFKEARVFLAKRVHHVETHQWTAGVESLISAFGDRVLVRHATALSGRAEARVRKRHLSGSNVTGVRLSDPVVMEAGKAYAIDLQREDKVIRGIAIATAAGTTRDLMFTVARAQADAPRAGDLIAFGELGYVTEDLEIVDIEPDGATAAMTAVRYAAAEIMAAETGPVPPLPTVITPRPVAPTPRLIGEVSGSPDGVTVAFDLDPVRGSTIEGITARWRMVVVGDDTQTSAWTTLPLEPPGSRVIRTPAFPEAQAEPGDAEAEYRIDLEIRTVLRSGARSEPLILQGIVIRRAIPNPSDVWAEGVTRNSPDGSSYSALAVGCDPLTSGIVQELQVEVAVAGESPPAWRPAGTGFPANAPTGDCLDVDGGEEYLVRFRWRSADRWVGAWVVFGEPVEVPAGGNVSNDTVNVSGRPATEIVEGLDAVPGLIDVAVAPIPGLIEAAVAPLQAAFDSVPGMISTAIAPLDAAIDAIPGQIAAAVAPLDAAIDAVPGLISAAIAPLDAAIDAVPGQIAAAVAPLDAAIDAVPGLISAAIGPLNTAIAGLDASVDQLVPAVLDPATGLVTRMGTVETQVGSALTRVSALEVTVNTPTTGLLARAATLETAVSNLNTGKADASRVTVLEARVSSLGTVVIPERPSVASDFVEGRTTSPTGADLAKGVVVTVAGEGQVREFAAMVDVDTRLGLPIVAGRTYRASARTRVTVEGVANRVSVYFRLYSATWTYLDVIGAASDTSHVLADNWQTLAGEATATAMFTLAPTAAFVRAEVRGGANASNAYSGATWQLAVLRLENVTGEVALGARIGTVETAVANLQTGKAEASRVTTLETQVQTAGTGLLARMTTAETAVSDLQANKAAASRVTTLETQVQTAGTGLLSRMGTVETSVSDLQTGKADASRVTTLETAINTPTTGITARLGTAETAISDLNTNKAAASRVTLLETQVQTAGTGLLARMTSAETAVSDLQTGKAAASRVTTLETQVQTAGTGLLARMGTAETSISDLQTNKAAASRVTTLETQVQTAGTGLLARMGTVETSVSNLQTGKADASRVTALETRVSSLATTSVLPDRPSVRTEFMNATGSGFTPEQAASIDGLYSVVADAAEGDVLQVTPTAADIYTRGALPVRTARTFRLSYRARVTADGGAGNRATRAFRLYTSAWAYLGTVASVADDTSFVVADGWLANSAETTSAAILTAWPTAAYVRASFAGGRDAGGAASGATWQLAQLRLADVTDEVTLGGRVTTVEGSVANLQTGKADASRVTALEATVNTPTTGLSARMSTAETAVADLQTNKAAATRVTTLETQVQTAGTGLLSRMGTAETSISDLQTGKAAASRVTTLETQVQTPTTGLLARMGTAETAISDLGTNKAAASRVTLLETQVQTAGTGLLARMGTAETAISDLGSGKADASRVTTLETAINTPTTGITARLGTAETAISDLNTNKAASSRVTTLETQVQTAGTGLLSRMGSAETAISDLNTGKAAASRVTTLETQVQTPTTGLLARTGSLETSVSNLQTGKAEASRVTTLEAQVVGLVGSTTPEDFLSESVFHTSSETIAPGAAGSNLGGTFPVVAGVGKVHERVGFAISTTRAVMPATAGRIYETEVVSRITANSSQVGGTREQAVLAWIALNADYSLWGYITGDADGQSVRPVFRHPDGWQTFKNRLTIPVGAAYAFVRPRWYYGYSSAAPNGDGTIQVAKLALRDVTDARSALARVGVAETAITNLQTGKADASRVTTLETQVQTAGTGLLARMTTAETSVSNLQTGKADATRVTTLEARVANVRGRVIPDRPSDGTEFSSSWSSGQSPDAIAANAPGSVVAVAGEGDVRQIAGGFNLITRGGLSVAGGKTFRFYARLRAETDGTATRLNGWLRAYTSSWAYLGAVSLGMGANLSLTVVEGWKALSVEVTAQAIFNAYPTAANVRPHLRVDAAAGDPGGVYQVATLGLEDVSVEAALGSRVGLVETAVTNLQTGKADASRVTTLETTINTPATGLTARVGTVETSVSNLQTGKADATRVSTLEARASAAPRVAPGFQRGNEQWTATSAAGDPAAGGNVTGGTYPAIAGTGYVLELAAGAFRTALSRGVLAAVVGKTYELKGRARIKPGSVSTTISVTIQAMNADWTIANDFIGFTPDGAISSKVNAVEADGWIEFRRRVTVAPGAAYSWLRPRVYTAAVAGAYGAVQVADLTLEEITDAAAIESRVVTAEQAIADLDGYTLARWSIGTAVPGATAFIEARAETVPGSPPTSDVAIGARVIALYNQVGDEWINALTISGGNALFAGALQAGTGVRVGTGGNTVAVALQSFKRTIADGTVVSFPDLGAIPDLEFSQLGLAPLSAGETYNLYADSPTATGFTARLKINTPGTPSSVNLTVDAAGGAGNPTRTIDKASNPDATDNTYTVTATAALTCRFKDSATGAFIGYGGTVVLSVWAKHAGVWSQVGTLTAYLEGEAIGEGSTDWRFDSLTMDVTDTFTIAAGVQAFGVSLQSASGGYPSGGGGSVTDLDSVSWTTPGSSSGVRSATPSGQTSTVTVRPKN